MNTAPPFSRAEFEHLLAEHEQLIAAANALEFQLHRLGGLAPDARVSACQQAGGDLIRLLRDALFRQDQQVLPLLEALLAKDAPS
jgi:hypothetical protein